WRRADRHPLDARDDRRDHGHGHRGRILGPSTRHVATGPCDGTHDLAEPNAVALVPPLQRELSAVEVGETIDQGGAPSLPLRRNGSLGSLNPRGRDGEPRLSEVRAVELQRQVEQGLVALDADAFDDTAYCVGYGGIDLGASGRGPPP